MQRYDAGYQSYKGFCSNMTRRNYNDPEYAKWRQAVRKRDGKRCQMPGCGSRKRIQVHHIQKWSRCPSLRYEVSNGICLCYYCHAEINTHEEHYVGLFLEIIGNKNG